MSCAKTAEPIETLFGWWAQKTFIRWGAHTRHLANMTESSMCGGDVELLCSLAVLCQITLTTCSNKSSAVAEMGDRARAVGRKVGAAVPLSLGSAGSPSSIMSPAGPRPTSVPSGILNHPTVWPQYTNVTDRLRTDNGMAAWGEPF